MITHSRKRSFYNWVARLLTLVLMLSTASQLSLANSYYGTYSALLPGIQGESVPISQQTLSSTISANAGKYGTEILTDDFQDTVDSISKDDNDEGTVYEYSNDIPFTDFLFYKIENSTGDLKAFEQSEFIEWNDSNDIPNLRLTVAKGYTIYIKHPSAVTTTDVSLDFHGEADVILDSLNFEGKQAMMISTVPNGHNVYIKGDVQAVSTSYPFDVKKKMSLLGYDDSSSLTCISRGSGSSAYPGIRVCYEGKLTIESGNITAVSQKSGSSQSSGIGRTDTAPGAVEINGGTVYAEGYVGIGGQTVFSGYPITVNGGDVTAMGTYVGIGSSSKSTSTSAGDITVNGGTVYAYGGTYAIQTYRNGSTKLNGGVTYAYTGGTTSIGLTSVNSNNNTGTLKAEGDGAVLFRNGNISQGEASYWNLAVFTISNTDTDPYATYYGTANHDLTTENDIWYGRVYGEVNLNTEFTMGATSLTRYSRSYDSETKKIVTTEARELISCDGMLLDIPPSSSDTVGNVKNRFRTVEGDVNLLTLEEDSIIRFKGVAVEEPVKAEKTEEPEEPKGLTVGDITAETAIATNFASAYKTSHYQWQEGTPAPVGENKGSSGSYGEIQIILSDELIWNSATYGDKITVAEGLTTYHSEVATGSSSAGYSPNGYKGYVHIYEAGHGNFWDGVGVAGVSYRSSAGADLGAKAVAAADTYAVTVSSTGARSWNADKTIKKSDVGIKITMLGTAYSSFTVEPYDITSGTSAKNEDLPSINVAVTEVAPITDIIALDANGQLKVLDSKKITVKNPFGGDDLVENQDYVLTFQAVPTGQDTLATDDVSIKLAIQGVGNYTGIYVDNEVYKIIQADGKLGKVDVTIDWGVDNFDSNNPETSPIFVKPDGEADFSALKITNSDKDEDDDDYLLYDGKNPGDSTVLTAEATNVDGTLYYKISISIDSTKVAGTPFAPVGEEELDTTTLEFTVIARQAGEGDSFDSGSLHLVSNFYQRPDCALYPEDLVLYNTTIKETTSKETTSEETTIVKKLVLGTDYTLEYQDKTGTWNPWTQAVDCEALTGKDCDVDPEDHDEDDHFSTQFQVRVTKGSDVYVEGTTTEYLEFNATWATGGSNPGHVLNQGILYNYQNNGEGENGATVDITPAVYVLQGYGLVLSAADLELFAEVYQATETSAVAQTREGDGDESGDGSEDESAPETGGTKVVTVELTDNDLAFVSVLSDFESYYRALAGKKMDSYDKSYIYTIDADGNKSIYDDNPYAHFSPAKSEATIVTEGDGTGDGVEAEELTWYICLAGSGAYSGSISFQIDYEHIVFMDILEDVVGILDDQLVLDPNEYLGAIGEDSKVYQKPDGTLHEEDVKKLWYRLPSLTSDHSFQEHTMATVDYDVAYEVYAEKGEAEEVSQADVVQYELTITGKEGSELEQDVVTDGNLYSGAVVLDVYAAGSGASLFRHGYIDLVPEKYTVSYVPHSGTDLDGDSVIEYSASEQAEILAQLEFYHDNVKMENNYTIQFVIPFMPYESNGDYTNIQECTVMMTNTGVSGDSVTFQITIEMQAEDTGAIYYNGNGSNVQGLPTSTEYKFSQAFALPETNPTQDGYTFTGWALNADGSEALPDENANVETFSQLLDYAKGKSIEPVDNALILYAQWEENKYEVTFNPGDGASFADTDTIVQRGSKNEVILPPANPTRTGYAFDGWSETQATEEGTSQIAIGEGTTYGEIATDTEDQKAFTGNLYAMWTELEPYHIYFDLNYDGGGITDITIDAKDYSGDTTVPLPSPSREGYDYKGWKNSNNIFKAVAPKYGELVFETIKDKNEQEIKNVAILYAEWNANTYTIYFESDGKDVEEEVEEVSEAQKPPKAKVEVNWYDPIKSEKFPEVTKENHSFTGWLVKGTTNAYFTENMSFSQLAPNDQAICVTLVAQWQEDFKDPEPEPPVVTPPVVTPPVEETPEPEPEPEEDNSGNTGGNSGSSGGSSNDNDSTTTTPQGNEETKVEVNNSTVNTTLGTTVTDDSITATILPEDMDNAVSEGAQVGDNYDIVFKIPSAGNIGSFEANWDREVYSIFQESEANSLSFQANGVVITFDREAVDYLSEKTSSTGSIAIEAVAGETLEDYGTRPVYDISLKTGNTEINNLDSGLMKITIPYKDTKTGNLLGGRTQGTEVDYLVKSYHDGASLQVLADRFGQYGVVTRDNTEIMYDYIGSWTEDFVHFVDARRLYVVKDAISMDESITRGMFVAMLGEMEGAGDSVYNSQFRDVASDSPYAPYVQWAYDNGIVFGKGNGRFDPDAPITREEMAVMLQTYLDFVALPLESVGDTDKFMDETTISDWAIDAVKTVQDFGLVHGYVNNLYKPYDSTTYAEHAVMTMRLIETMVCTYTLDLY